MKAAGSVPRPMKPCAVFAYSDPNWGVRPAVVWPSPDLVSEDRPVVAFLDAVPDRLVGPLLPNRLVD
jgi:hypothetical protein